jgi:hypothetical protein
LPFVLLGWSDTVVCAAARAILSSLVCVLFLFSIFVWWCNPGQADAQPHPQHSLALAGTAGNCRVLPTNRIRYQPFFRSMCASMDDMTSKYSSHTRWLVWCAAQGCSVACGKCKCTTPSVAVISWDCSYLGLATIPTCIGVDATSLYVLPMPRVFFARAVLAYLRWVSQEPEWQSLYGSLCGKLQQIHPTKHSVGSFTIQHV